MAPTFPAYWKQGQNVDRQQFPARQSLPDEAVSDRAHINRRDMLKLGAAALGTGAFLTGCASDFGTSPSYLTAVLEPKNHNTVYHWVDIVLQQTRDQRVAPPRAAYNYAAPMVAGFLAANAIIGRYEEPYGIGRGPKGADPEAAYGAAFAAAAAENFQQPFIFERKTFLNRIPDGAAKTLGAEWGRRVGLEIVRMRTRDGAEPNKVDYYLGRYPRRTDQMNWDPTSAAYGVQTGPRISSYGRGLYPGFGHIKPWTLRHTGQFRPEPFYDPASPEFAEDFDLIRQIGGTKSTLRTEDQSEIALFWEDGPWGITPPGHFLFIAVQVLQSRGFDFLDTARAFALLGMTQCDAAINSWDSKYHHDILRPSTAIRTRSAAFGNPDKRIVEDAGWESFIPTPNFPSYTSGHSTFGAAGTEMTALLLGTDKVTFSHESPDQVGWPQIVGARRTWTSLSQAAEENGWSRLYGGVHWRLDHTAAMKAGRQIAQQAFETMFQRKV